MNCIDFLEGDLKNHIIRVWETETSPVIFVHIPKTGGTSLQRDLNMTFPNSLHVPQEDKERHWQDALNRLQSEPPSIVRGHLNHKHLHDLSEKKIETRWVTYLRHPADRLVSQFIWAKSNHRKDPKKYTSPGPFDKYCEHMSKNYFCDLLVGQTATADEAIAKVVDRFWFVGVTEFSHVCQAVLFAAMGERYRVRQRRNQTLIHDEDKAEIDDHCLKHAMNSMQIDLALFEFFYSKWSARINDVIELLMKQSKLPTQD